MTMRRSRCGCKFCTCKYNPMTQNANTNNLMLSTNHNYPNTYNTNNFQKYSYNNNGNNRKIVIKFVANPNACIIEAKLKDGLIFPLLLDTGATFSLISRNFINTSTYLTSLEERKDYKQTNLKIGNGKQMLIQNYIIIEMTIQNVPIRSKFYIVEYNNAYPILMGLDTLRDLSCKIDLVNNTITIRNKYITARNKYDTVIPPHTAKSIDIKANLPFSFIHANLICKTCKRHNSILPKYTKTRASSLLAYNDTDKPVCIPKDCVLGSIKICPDKNLTTNLQTIHTLDLLEEYNRQAHPTHKPLVFKEFDTPPIIKPRINKQQLIPPIKQINNYNNKRPVVNPQKYKHLDPSDPLLFTTDKDLINKQLKLDNTKLSKEGECRLRKIIANNSDAFSLRGEIGCCQNICIDFTLNNEEEFYIRPFYSNKHDKEQIQKEVDKLLSMGIIEKGESSYVSPAFLVKKYDQNGHQKNRMVVDFRFLNTRIQRPNFSPNLFKQAIELIGNEKSRYITLIDIKSAFYALPLSERAQKFTAFSPYHGSQTYIFKRLAMGLCISPCKFTSVILNILSEIPNSSSFVIPLMDDILIVSQTEKQHMTHVKSVLEVIKRHGLKLSLDKCFFAQKRFNYMGYTISYDQDGNPLVSIESSKIDAILKLPPPKTIRKLRAFLGMVLFLAPHLKDLQILAKPLYELTKSTRKNAHKYNPTNKLPWTEIHDKAFRKIKQLLVNPPVLFPPTQDGEFLIEIDTSKIATGAKLIQNQNGKNRLISYYSKSLPDSAKRYSPTELEMCGLVICLHAFKHLLSGKHFYVMTDHSAIVQILKSKTLPPSRRIARFLEKLSQYDFTISYLKSSKIVIPDFLSRHPVDKADDPIRPVAFYDITKSQAQNLIDSIENNAMIMTRSAYKKASRNNNDTPPNDKPHRPTHGPSPRRIKTKSKPFTNSIPPTHPTVVDREPRMFRLKPNRPAPEPSWHSARLERTDNIAKTNQPNKYISVPKRIGPQQAPSNENPFLQPDKITIADINTFPDTCKSIIQRELNTHNNNITSSLEEVHELPDRDAIFKFGYTKPLFDTEKFSKAIVQKITHQREIDPIIKMIKERAMTNYNLNFTNEALKQQQRSDPYFKHIYKYLSDGSLPSNKKELKLVTKYAEDFFLYNEILFKYSIHPTTSLLQYKLCIPKNLVPYILELYHSSLLSGHQAFTRTYLTIKDLYFFPSMYQTVMNFIKACTTCQERKSHNTDKYVVHPKLTPFVTPFQYLSLDVKQMYKSPDGYVGFLLIVDEVSNYVEAYPVKNETAKEISSIFIENILLVYGPPCRVSSDLGKSMDNAIMRFISKALHYDLKFVSAFGHHSLKAERYIQNVQNILIANLRNRGNHWPLFLKPTCFSMNIHATSSLGGFTPYEILFKTKPPSLDKFNIEAAEVPCGSFAEYINEVKQRFSHIEKTITQLRENSQNARLISTSRTTNQPTYTQGSLVYVLSPDKSNLFTNNKKIKLSYVGPFIVYSNVDKHNVLLVDLFGRLMKNIFNIRRLKPCYLQNKEGKIITTRDELLSLLKNSNDPTVSQIRNAIHEKRLQLIDNEKIPLPITQASNTPLNLQAIHINDTKLLLQHPSDNTNNQYLKQGSYIINRARLKDNNLQFLLSLSDSNKDRQNSFYIQADETSNLINILNNDSLLKHMRITGSFKQHPSGKFRTAAIRHQLPSKQT